MILHMKMECDAAITLFTPPLQRRIGARAVFLFSPLFAHFRFEQMDMK